MIAPMGVHVSLIEINEKKANRLSEALPDVNVIYGDGTDQELLEQEAEILGMQTLEDGLDADGCVYRPVRPR